MFEASILPDVQCWNVAAVRGSHSNWPRALSSVLRMEQLEVVPDVVTFSTEPWPKDALFAGSVAISCDLR